MASDASMQMLASVIASAQTVIKENRNIAIKASAEKMENFLADNNLPIDPFFEEKEYFCFNVYPIINFMDVVNTYNKLIREQILTDEDKKLLHSKQLDNKEAYCNPFIYNFIHNVYYKKFQLLSFRNIFYPHNNNKFIFETYKAKGRLIECDNVSYIHPKYRLEEEFHKRYSIDLPENYVDKLITEWAKIDNEYESVQVQKYKKIIAGKYSKLQNKILRQISEHTLECFYDQSIPTVLTDFIGLDFIKHIFKTGFNGSECVENSSKSFFDNRADNFIFKVDKKVVVKVFPILDYELIPCLQKNRRKVHIDVAIRLAFNEYITYKILGFNELAASKLRQHKNLCLRRTQLKLLPLEKYRFTGKYFPYDMYLKEMKIQSILDARK
jgi:hypothetical protein